MKRGAVELFDFQRDGVAAILEGLLRATYTDVRGTIHRGCAFLLHDEMGLGKTMQTWEALRQLRNQGQLAKSPILVVGPASAIDSVWLAGDCKHFEEFTVTKDVCDASKLDDSRVVVLSYDQLLMAYKHYVFHQMVGGRLSNDELLRYCFVNNRSTASTDGMYGDDLRRALFNIAREIDRPVTKSFKPGIMEFMHQKWGCIVFDEIHRIKSTASATLKAVGFMDSRFRICLSGTPIMNQGSDLLNILKFGLRLNHVDWGMIKSQPNGNYTRTVTQTFMLGREKSNLPEMIPHLPKRVKEDEVVVLPWTDPQQKQAYILCKQDSLGTIEAMDRLKQGKSDQRRQLSQTFMARLQRLRQICLHKDLPTYMRKERPVQTRIRWSPSNHMGFSAWNRRRIVLLFRFLRLRTPLHRDLCYRIVATFCWEERTLIDPSIKMQSVLPYIQEKFIVFCTFRVFLEAIMQPWLTQIGIKSIIFSGGSKKAQQEALRCFNEDQDVRAMLIVKSAGAEGLNLQHASGVCIIMDPHFNIALDEQAAQRIDRIGQRRDVIVRRLFMQGSIDEAMRVMQEHKTNNVDAWLRNKTTGRSIDMQKQFLRTFDTVS